MNLKSCFTEFPSYVIFTTALTTSDEGTELQLKKLMKVRPLDGMLNDTEYADSYDLFLYHRYSIG